MIYEVLFLTTIYEVFRIFWICISFALPNH